jgi:hypothetical protein
MNALDSRRTVADKRAGLMMRIRERAPREAQLEAADAYIAAIKEHGKVLGRKLPIPNRLAILRQLA